MPQKWTLAITPLGGYGIDSRIVRRCEDVISCLEWGFVRACGDLVRKGIRPFQIVMIRVMQSRVVSSEVKKEIADVFIS